MAVAYLICTTIIWLHCWKCYSCILRPYRFDYWMPSLNPPIHTHTHPHLCPPSMQKHVESAPRVFGREGAMFCPPFRLAPFSDLSLKGGRRGGWECHQSWHEMPKERERVQRLFVSSAAPCFSVFSLSLFLFLAVSVSSESLFTKNEKKKKKYILHWPRSLHPSVFFFPFKKSFLFLFLIYQQGALRMHNRAQ